MDEHQRKESSALFSSPMVSVVVPFYNEERGIAPFFKALLPVLQACKVSYEIVCVNDGSTDSTLARLLFWQQHFPQIRIVDLSRNFGKEAALSAGLKFARGQAVIPMDCDLQDPPELIPRMVQKWQEGYDMVLAKREDRSSDSLAKRLTAKAFYKIYNLLSDRPIPEDVGDFRLMDRKVVRAILSLPERHRFMKGIFAWVGFRTATITYSRPPRSSGTTKWNYRRLWNLAIEGITSFSAAPLRIWFYVGLSTSLLAFAYAAFIFLRTLILGRDVPGYASLIVVQLFLGGMQLLCLGILGEYLGKVYGETKRRPLYIVKALFEPTRGPEALEPPDPDKGTNSK